MYEKDKEILKEKLAKALLNEPKEREMLTYDAATLLNTVAASDVYKQKLLTDVATTMVAIDNIKKNKKEDK